MHASVRTMRFGVIAVVLSAAVAVAGCGGGSSVATPAATAPPATTTQGIPTTGGTVALPAAANGQSATLGIAAGAPAGVAITATSFTSAPPLTPAPSSLARKAQAISGAVPFFYVTFSVSATLAVKYISSQSVSLVSADPVTAGYFVEFDDITAAPATSLGSAGPVTAVNGIASFVSGNASQQTGSLLAGHSYLMQFYYIVGGGPSPSPSASPTGSASASPSPGPSASSSAAPTAQPSATASAALSGLKLNNTSVALPSLNGGAYSGTITSGTYTGSPTDQYTVTFGNYFFGGAAAPTAPPGAGNVYAQVSVIIPTAPTSPAPQWTTVPQNMSLTLPTVAGKSTVTVRMWEAGTITQPTFQALCLDQTTGGPAFIATPQTNGSITFPSPFTLSTVSGAALTACNASHTTNDANLNPLFGSNAGVWILVTDS